MMTFHASTKWAGHSYCAVLEGPEKAWHSHVTFQGVTARVLKGSCVREMHHGHLYEHMKGRSFITDNHQKVHWDGDIWEL
mmetsp:Transcript_6688/g.13216  ORF Transcript_6688/g.13216 Transcript_6688/m.13216 type:complete len:80 (-) Transcript_6688:189-428(-)